MPHPKADAVANRADAAIDATLERLKGYLAVPAISCDPEHAADVRRLAEQVRDDLAAIGLDGAQVLDVEGALPLVVAHWLKAGADKPTILIYGHLDLQPVKGESWDTDPHVATVRGDRM